MGLLPAALILSIKCLLFSQLAYCIVQFLEKDPALTEPVSAVNVQGLSLIISLLFNQSCVFLSF